MRSLLIFLCLPVFVPRHTLIPMRSLSNAQSVVMLFTAEALGGTVEARKHLQLTPAP